LQVWVQSSSTSYSAPKLLLLLLRWSKRNIIEVQTCSACRLNSFMHACMGMTTGSSKRWSTSSLQCHHKREDSVSCWVHYRGRRCSLFVDEDTTEEESEYYDDCGQCHHFGLAEISGQSSSQLHLRLLIADLRRLQNQNHTQTQISIRSQVTISAKQI